ncbi:hypothetical protein MITSMUL_03004 [Mitsuokella multacida DSM 20544]|uniref:Copper-sensing transcriptional repressor CsoR n=2 Tax=Mitsuokella multacida TaxID=52226 RepID=C9KJ07_9FIRM|nr:hypothetical protein MITSMUL_03004 [Mitsuokella multacida DSM 20544]
MLERRKNGREGRIKTIVYYNENIRQVISRRMEEKEHTHVLADGTVIHHNHHAHGAHGHQHSHTQTKAVLNRMARLIGHLESIKHMIEDGRDCSEVLVQLSAVDSAIKGVSRIILKDHLEHCIVDAVRDNDQQALEQLNRAIDRFIK